MSDMSVMMVSISAAALTTTGKNHALMTAAMTIKPQDPPSLPSKKATLKAPKMVLRQTALKKMALKKTAVQNVSLPMVGLRRVKNQTQANLLAQKARKKLSFTKPRAKKDLAIKTDFKSC